MIDWVNLTIFILSLVFFAIFYTFSLQPMKLEEKIGKFAWKKCYQLRIVAGALEFISVVNMILWIWFPVEELNWKVSDSGFVTTGIFAIIFIPGALIVYRGIKDAGTETMAPSEKTKMYRGIYQHIRHPQSLGEFPMWVALGFLFNSWILVVISVIYIVVYVPIMIYFEEQDLVKRFGDPYKEYKKRTGALFPKLKKTKL